MPVENKKEEQRQYTHLEAFARTLVGIAPWLETPALDAEEEKLRVCTTASLCAQALDAATDPESPDFMNFSARHSADRGYCFSIACHSKSA